MKWIDEIEWRNLLTLSSSQVYTFANERPATEFVAAVENGRAGETYSRLRSPGRGRSVLVVSSSDRHRTIVKRLARSYRAIGEEVDSWKDRIDKVLVEKHIKPVRLTEEPEMMALLRQLTMDVERLRKSRAGRTSLRGN